jgi:murein DD-endopeptidase MepM/ murein hydrolase activator NlpD
MTRHIIPVPDWCVVTQTYDEHVARAKANGWCYRPGQQCSTYYYGGVDYAPPWARVQEPVNIRASADGVIERVSTDTTGYGKHIRLITGDNELTI